jgi:hypothetical protein
MSRGAHDPSGAAGSIAMLAIASGNASGTHGDQIVVTHRTNVRRLKCHERLCSTRCGDELNAEGARTVDLDDGTEIAATQPVRGQIARQHHHVE